MNRRNFFIEFSFLFFLLLSCGNKPDKEYQIHLPSGFERPIVPEDNPLTEKKVALGELLFFDPIVSDDSTISCSSCHIPELAFTDGVKVPIGVNGNVGTRNSPSLVNVAYYPYFFSEGKVKDLETQALAPGLHEAEMGTEMKQMIYRLRKNKFYRNKFKEIFGEPIELKHFVYVIASYERSLIAANSRYDQYLESHDSTLLSAEENLGMALFFSDRTNCSKCHNGNLFTDFSLQNIGLYEVYKDPGLARANSLGADSGKFKTPSLRNIEFTGPYMHDGSLGSLGEVVEFYNSGGENHPVKNKWIKPLNLSNREKEALVSFLKILTDEDLKNKSGIFKTPELIYAE